MSDVILREEGVGIYGETNEVQRNLTVKGNLRVADSIFCDEMQLQGVNILPSIESLRETLAHLKDHLNQLESQINYYIQARGGATFGGDVNMEASLNVSGNCIVEGYVHIKDRLTVHALNVHGKDMAELFRDVQKLKQDVQRLEG